MEKRNLNNKEGWENFNKEMYTREEELRNKEYPDLEKEVIEMKKTVGKAKIRTDKEPKPNNTQIKEAKVIRKEKKATYQKTIKENLTEKKKEALTEYIEAQKNLRTAIEEHENKKTEEKIDLITNVAKINPKMAIKPSSADTAAKQTKPRNTSFKNVRRSREMKNP